MIYRVKQFFWHITSRWKSIDDKLIEKYLNKKEVEIFNRLNVSEQQHCIRVCNDALEKADKENIGINKNKLAKAALLHDVGKTMKSLNVLDKSIIVILDKFTNGNLRKYTKIKKIDVYYNHPKKGVRILEDLHRYDNELLEVVKKHHKESKESEDNIYLKIIRECDNKN